MIRPAGPDDAEAIARVHVRTWQAGYRKLLPQEFLDQLSVSDRAEMWRSRLRLPGQPARPAVLVAERHGEVAGFISVGPSRDDDGRGASEIYALYVAPEHWRTGLGGALVAESERALAVAHPMTLWVLKDNERGNAFYRRVGFLPDDKTKEVVFGATRLVELRLRKHALGSAPFAGRIDFL